MQFDFLQYDLITPDGRIVSIQHVDDRTAIAQVTIENIQPNFVGFELDSNFLLFNIKSTLAQLGVNGIGKKYELEKGSGIARIEVELKGIGPIGREMLTHLQVG